MRLTKTNIKNLVMVTVAALAVSAISARADFNPPGQVPPAGNVDAPVYKVGTGQTLTGSLTVTASSGVALTGSSVGYGLQGIVTTDAAGGDAALYGYAFGADATDYAGVFYGGLGVQLASGDIYYLSRNSGISWPRASDDDALYGVSVTTTGELRLLGHGAGINFLNQSVSSLLTVSEAGVVNVAPGGSLQVAGVNVCLADGTNCPTPDLATGGGWTDDGAVVRLTTVTDKVGIGTTTPGAALTVTRNSNGWDNSVRLLDQNGGNEWNLHSDTNGQFMIGRSGLSGLTLDASGNINIPSGELRAKWLHSTAAGDNTFAGNLSVAGVLKAGEFRYNILNINDTDSRAQFKIKTNLPFSSSMQMPTVYISGYAYGWGVPVDLKIVWYIYEDNFINYSVSSSGGYTPTVKLARENGKVVIHLSPGYYYAKMSVSAVRASMGETDAHLQGWSWVDEAISGDKIVTVPYFTSFGDGLVAQSGDLKFNDNKSVRIDSQFGNTNLIFGNYLKDNGTWDSGFVYGGENDLNIAVEGSVKANALCIEETCRDTWGAIEGSQNLLSVLNTGSDASGFTGNTTIGGNVSVPSGELRAKWLHSTEAGDNTFAGNVILNGASTAYLGLIAVSGTQSPHTAYQWNPTDGSTIWRTYADYSASSGLNYYRIASQNGGNVRMTIDSTGNVGIGTTAPQAKFHTFGPETSGGTYTKIAQFSSRAAANQNYGNNAYYLSFTDDVEAGSNFYEAGRLAIVRDNTGAATDYTIVANRDWRMEFSTTEDGTLGTRMTIDNNGKVGIGTTAPNAKLEVSAGTGNENIRIYSGNHNESASSFNYQALSYHAWKDGALQNATGQIKFVDRPGTSGFPNAVRTSDIVFQTAHNWNGASYGQYLDDTMIIKADQNGGNVGIGAATPGAKLEVRASSGRALRVYNDMDLYNTLLFTDASWNEQGRISGSSYNMFVDALGDAQIHIDTDNNSVNTFKIVNGADATVLTVDESGNGTFAGTLTVGGQINASGNNIIGLPAIPSGDTAAASKAYVDAAVGAATSGGSYGEKHYFISSGAITGAAGGYAGLDAFCNSDASAMPGRAYHAYASVASGRGFRNGYIYSNKSYGSFALLGSQDPDLCRLGLSGNCNANWASNSSVYVWRTDEAMYCSAWQSSSPTENSVFSQIFRTTTAIPTLDTQSTASLCSTAQRVLCLENTGAVTAPRAPFLVDLSYTWEQARNYCISQGAHLAYIQSTGDNNYMQSLAAGNNVWIGLNDQASEGTFVWENGSAYTYANWYNGQPNNEGGNEDCAELRNDWSPAGKWNDQNCSGAQKFICR